MKNKKSVLLLALAFAVLMGGAAVLYRFLGSRTEINPLTIINSGAQTPAADTRTPAAGTQTPAATQAPDAADTQTPGTADTQTPDAAAQTPAATQTPEEEQADTGEAPEDAMMAPDFTVIDSNGNEHKLSDFFGKPIVLNFWASWCGPCKSEMPDFEEVYTEYKNDIHFLMVNLTDGYQETIASASEFISKQGYTFPVYYDTESEAAAAYYVYAIPTTYFIDKDGYLTAYAQSALSKNVLLQGIGMIFEE